MNPTFFFDNNISRTMAHGMRAFGENVVHLQDNYPDRVDGEIDDVVWIPDVGRDGLIVVTRDLAIRRKPPEIAAYREHSVGGFWLGGKNLTACQMIMQLVRSWPRMKDLASKTPKPFIWVVPPNGTQFERRL